MHQILATPITNSTIKTMARRMFGETYHTFYTLSPDFPQTPESYMCWIDGCRNPAVGLGLRNIKGSVLPFFGCKACRQKLNGAVSDDIPEMKRVLLGIDGSPINPMRKAA